MRILGGGVWVWGLYLKMVSLLQICIQLPTLFIIAYAIIYIYIYIYIYVYIYIYILFKIATLFIKIKF